MKIVTTYGLRETEGEYAVTRCGLDFYYTQNGDCRTLTEYATGACVGIYVHPVSENWRQELLDFLARKTDKEIINGIAKVKKEGVKYGITEYPVNK